MKGTAITNLEFIGCSFFAGEFAKMLTNAFSRNTSLLSIRVASKFDEALNGALTAALPSNTTLQEISFGVFPANLSLQQLSYSDRFDTDQLDHSARLDWSPIFSALGNNTGLQTLSVEVYNGMDESLCTAIKDGLGTNTTLQHLKLKSVRLGQVVEPVTSDDSTYSSLDRLYLNPVMMMLPH
jgi:hypothetical protein